MKIFKEKEIFTKQNLKKIIAILCAVTLLPWGSFVGQKAIEAQASEGENTITSPDELEQWTIADVGWTTGNYTFTAEHYGKNATATGITMDKKAFVAHVKFPEVTTGHNAILCVGGEYDNDKISGFEFIVVPGVVNFRFHSNGVLTHNFGKLDPSKFGMDTLLGKNLKLTLTTEFVNNNGVTTDVKVGLYINDILYNNEYLNLTNVPVNSLQQQVSTYTRWSGSLPIWLGTPVTPIEEFEEWNIKTVSFPKNIGTSGGYGTATGKSMDGTAFRTKVKFPTLPAGKFAEIWFYNNRQGLCLRTYPDGVGAGNLQLLYFKSSGNYPINVTITPEDVGMTGALDGRMLEVILTTELVKQADETYDVYIGLYINGNLYKGDYIIGKNVLPSHFMQNLHGYNTYGGANIELATCITNPRDLEAWDIDTINLPKKSTTISGLSGTATGKMQNGTAFRTKITYPANLTAGKYADMWIGTINNGYLLRAYPDIAGSDGLLFYLRDNTGRYPIQNVLPTAYAVLKPEDFNLTESLVGRELEFILTVETEVQADGTTTAYVGIYIDGNLYKNNYLVIPKVYATSVPQNVLLVTQQGNAVVSVDTFKEEIKQDNGVSYAELGASGYALTTTGSIVVDGVQKTNGDVINTIGDYRIVNTEFNQAIDKNEIKSQTVVLWKTGAVNKDGDVDVRDIISLKKLTDAGTTVYSRAVKKGADVNGSGTINAEDCGALRDLLVGKTQ